MENYTNVLAIQSPVKMGVGGGGRHVNILTGLWVPQ